VMKKRVPLPPAIWGSTLYLGGSLFKRGWCGGSGRHPCGEFVSSGSVVAMVLAPASEESMGGCPGVRADGICVGHS
jgi:hypothetical protein